MNILFISLTDPKDKKALSGTIYTFYIKLLDMGHNVEWVGNYTSSYSSKILHTLIKTYNKLFNKNIPYLNSPFFSRDYKYTMQPRIDKMNYDMVFAPMASSLIAGLNFNRKPIIYLTDAVFKSLIDYYIFNFPQRLFKTFNQIEQHALVKADKIAVFSDWAKSEIKSNYNISDEKISVLPLGPNFIVKDCINTSTLEIGINKCLNLIFIGVDWERKGGDLVMEIYFLLRKNRIETKLTIVGCIPPEKWKIDENIKIYKSLDKNNDKELEILLDLYRKAHFLIQPSRAECYGIVFSEAAYFGVPSLATRTGGITSAVRENSNGFTFDLNDSAIKYVDKITYFLSNPLKYQELRISSRKFYEVNANWDLWSRKIKAMIHEIENK